VTPGEAFVDGALHVWHGARLVAGRRDLWPYVLGPALLLGSLVLGTAVIVWNVAGNLFALAWAPGEGEGRFAWWVGSLLVRSACVLASAVVWYLGSSLLAAPFLERLSQEVEVVAIGRPIEDASWRLVIGELLVSIAHSSISFVLWLVVLGFCAALNVVPVVGSLVAAPVATLATAFWLAREAMDGPMSRRKFRYRDKLRAVTDNLPSALGFGLVQSFVLWVPIVNLAVLPIAVAGGTLLYCRLEALGRVPAR
jgi:CysZ protein